MATTTLAVVRRESYWYPDDGGAVWLAGFQPVDAASGRYLARGAPELAALGVHVAAVAGTRHQGDALQSGSAAPGNALMLRRDPGNPHDAGAIAVDIAEGEQLGWVPRELAAELAPLLDRGEPWSAVALREQRATPRDPRTGLTMLLAPSAAITLDVQTSHR